MKYIITFIIINFCISPALAVDDLYTPSSTHRIVLPARYEDFREQQQKEDQLIPEKAKDARSTGAFISTVLDFHLQKYLQRNPHSQLHKMKNLEKSINEQTRVETDNIKIQPKLNLTQMRAEVDIESLVNSRIWLDNGLRTFNAQLDLYEINEGQVAVEYKSDNQESKTILGYKKSW